MPDAPQSERFKRLREWKNYNEPRETLCELVTRKLKERLEPVGEWKDELTDKMIQKTFDLFK